jgi:putative transcriptional regulator
MVTSDTITNNVLRYRTERGITQEQLAEQVSVSRQTIIAIERGNYTPSVTLALRIAIYFKTPVEKLFIMK